jgi:hypothetical protein
MIDRISTAFFVFFLNVMSYHIMLCFVENLQVHWVWFSFCLAKKLVAPMFCFHDFPPWIPEAIEPQSFAAADRFLLCLMDALALSKSPRFQALGPWGRPWRAMSDGDIP